MDAILQDFIERSIDIDVTQAAAWDLIREPGWFINGGRIGVHEIETRGNISVIRDAIYGHFEFETVTLEEPRYAVFRSLGGREWDDPVPNTLIEFWIEPVHAGGVRLRVRESGYAGFDQAEHAHKISASAQGWQVELEAAKRHLSRT